MKNEYYGKIKMFQDEIILYSKEIFAVYGNELLLRLEEYNLLENDNNCLESSTAFGYIIEEFLVSKLEIYSKIKKYKIKRPVGSTTVSSYDCFSEFNQIKALINIKADKQNNNAIAAINKLYFDYTTNPKQEKCYLILKIHYKIDISDKDKQRKIFIKKVDSFFIEEIDFSQGYKQDNRNWSKVYNANSGRLQATTKFRIDNKVDSSKVSYKKTKEMLENIYSKGKE